MKKKTITENDKFEILVWFIWRMKQFSEGYFNKHIGIWTAELFRALDEEELCEP